MFRTAVLIITKRMQSMVRGEDDCCDTCFQLSEPEIFVYINCIVLQMKAINIDLVNDDVCCHLFLLLLSLLLLWLLLLLFV